MTLAPASLTAYLTLQSLLLAPDSRAGPGQLVWSEEHCLNIGRQHERLSSAEG